MPEPMSPSILASAHTSPRVDEALSSANQVGRGSKVFCLPDLPFSPAKQHLTYFKFF